VLVARTLSGPSPLAPPPLMAPPGEAEVHEIEIEINNLIRERKPTQSPMSSKRC